MKKSETDKNKREIQIIDGVAFSILDTCELCHRDTYVSNNDICADCLEKLREDRDDPYLRAVRLKKIAQSETGIIQFARKLLRGRNSQRRVELRSPLEQLAKAYEPAGAADDRRIEQILGTPSVVLAKERESTGIVTEVVAINDELIGQLRSKPSDFYTLTPRRFEEFIAAILEKMGYEVQLTPSSHDHGRDVLAKVRLSTGSLLTVVQCKRYAPNRPIGIEIIERFLWTIERTDQASCGMLVTTSRFTSGATAKAAEFQYKLHLADFETIQTWIGPFGVWDRKKNSGIWVPP